MHDLNQIVVHRVAAEWEDVAFALKFDIPIVHAISETHKNNPTKCCKELFKKWLTTGHGVTPKIWKTLIRRLQEITDLAAATEEIIQDLVEMDSAM